MTPNTAELFTAQIPALKLMRSMGWDYLDPLDATLQRGGASDVLLRQDLVRWLEQHRFTVRGKKHPLSGGSIDQIVRTLAAPPMRDGLLSASEAMYTHILMGVTVTEFVEGKGHSITVPLVNWTDETKNILTVTEELSVLNTGATSSRRPDIVGYVNGLPLVVIEAKRPASGGPVDGMLAEGISQHIRNQGAEEIPQLFAYTQLLISIDGVSGRYGTTGTPSKFFARWREEEITKDEMLSIKKQGSPDGPDPLLQNRSREVREQMESFFHGPPKASEMDEMLIGLLRPDRFIAFVRYFTFYDRKYGKIAARYQQVFGIQELFEQLQSFDAEGRRKGGVIWHTTGSGKSFTMVLLCKALLLHQQLKQCRILVVTDRRDLEKQLANTFVSSGAFGSSGKAEKAKASSGRDLSKRIGMGRDRILFSTMQRFASAMKSHDASNESADLIVLIDEGHRSHSGETHERLRRALPHAAFLAFTGTPLLKGEKTKSKFGKILHAYTMQRAVEDGTVSPLLYEERKPHLSVNDTAIDNWFERVTETLTEAQKQDLKKKYARRSAVNDAKARIDLIAWDIATHFRDNFKSLNTGLKGQLATDSRRAAILYKEALDQTGLVTSAIVMSPPDTREGHTEVDGDKPFIQKWWSANITGDAEDYERQVIEDFGTPGKPDILIVVSKLLTGFDEPANAVLYIDKELKEHTLIQAIARVNRLHEAKPFGLLVDYRGILANLDSAMQSYAELAEKSGFEAEDIEGLFKDISTEYKQLPKLQRELHAIFVSVANKSDREQYRQILLPKLEQRAGVSIDINQKVREDFYAALTTFAMALKVALGSRSFFDDQSVTEAKIKEYKRDLKFFSELRRTARTDAQETIDYSAYDKQISRLLDTHIVGEFIEGSDALLDVIGGRSAGDIDTWSDEKIRNEAEAIRTRLTQTIEQTLAIDPHAQAHFSQLLRQAIDEAKAQFDHPRESFEIFRELEEDVESRRSLHLPPELKDKPHQAAYFGILKDQTTDATEEKLLSLSSSVDAMVSKAVAEFSISPKNIEDAVRKSVLPIVFAEYGLDVANKVVDQVINITRLGLSRGKS